MKRLLITFTLLLFPQQLSAQQTESKWPVNEMPETVKHRVVSAAEIERFRTLKSYQPVSREELLRLFNAYTANVSGRGSLVQVAEYSATLSDAGILHGKILWRLESAADDEQAGRSTILGATNLQNLQLYSDSDQLDLAADSQGQLIVPRAVHTGQITGTWNLVGSAVGQANVFQLELPPASISRLILKTGPQIVVTSPNALVQHRSQPGGMGEWILYPESSTALTINCASRTESLRNDSIGLIVNGECQFQKFGSEGNWSVGVPQSLTGGVLNISFSHPCHVRSVTAVGGAAVRWENAGAVDESKVRFWVPPAQAAVTINIKASMDPAAEVINVPFPVADSWQPNVSGAESPLLLRSSILRATVSPELIVTQLNATGAFEEEVQYGADESQLLIFNQFSQLARVTLFTVPSTAIIEDTVVIVQPDDHLRADALVSVLATSGFAGSFQWDVPTSWRVTEVTELGTGLPVLFRLTRSEESELHSTVDVTLRSPLIAGRVQTSQTIRISMQSTGGQLQREIPTLRNPEYQRQYDYFVPAVDGNRVRIQPGTEGLTWPQLREQIPWLPASDVEGAVAFAQKDLIPAPGPGRTNEGMTASVEYGVSPGAGVVTERLRLNVQSPSELPAEIPIRVTAGVQMNVATESSSVPAPLLRRVKTGGRFDDWLIRPQRRDGNTRELRLELTASRESASSLPATMIEIPNCPLTGGAVRPPSLDSGIVLLDADDQPIRQIQQYPDQPFDAPMRLQTTAADSRVVTVSGNAFLIADDAGVGLRTEAAYRLLVSSGRSSAELVVQCGDVESLTAFVGGHPVFGERTGDVWRLPLSLNLETSSVDLFLTTLPGPHHRSRLEIPTLTFPEADAVELNCFVLLPENRLPVSEGRSVDVGGQVATATASMPSSDSVSGQDSEHYRAERHFASRWRFAAAKTNTTCLLFSDVVSGVLEVPVHDLRFDGAKELVALLIVSLIWMRLLRSTVVGWWLGGICLLIFVVLYHTTSPSWQPVIRGTVYGIGIAGLCRVLRRFRGRGPFRSRRKEQISLQLTSVLVLAAGTSCYGFDEESLPQVLVPDSALPVVYVDGDWLGQLRRAAESPATDALVIEQQITLDVLSPTAGSVEFHCVVATPPDRACTLILPLGGLTLVGCQLDTVPVFPRRSPTGEATIVIPPTSELSAVNLQDNSRPIDSPGPDAIGSLVTRTVHYTVRLAPESLPGVRQFSIPHPPSPRTRLSVEDPMDIAATANLLGANKVVRSLQDHAVSFPVAFNVRRTDVAIVLRDAENAADDVSGNCEIVCRADVSPSHVRLTCEYRELPVTQNSQTVRIGAPRNYRVAKVETSDGTAMKWSTDSEELVIQVDQDLRENRQVVVQWATDTSITLQQSVPMQQLTTVNGQRSGTVTLLTSTPGAGLFFVETVTAQRKSLVETTVSALASPPLGLRPADRIFQISPDIRSVEVKLSRQETVREVSRLVQTAVVGDDEIQWSCRCEIDITGQPAFRQTLTLSPNVQLQSISARNGDVPRLQQWCRNGDLITVALREGIRGALVLELNGTLKREANIDTALPVVGLPVQILEYYLEISASPDSDVFIRDFAGTVPNSPLDIETTPIPENPIVLAVTDDSRPLVIRGTPERRIVADAVVVAYENNGQTFLGQFFSLRTSETAFRVPFSIPGTAAFATCATWIGDQGGLTSVEDDGVQKTIRVSPDSDDRVVLAITEIVMARDSDLVAIPIPEFGVEFTLEKSEAVDLRQTDGATVLPQWVQAAAAKTLSTQQVRQGRRTEAQFDSDSQRIELRLEQPGRSSETRQIASGPVFATTNHQVRSSGGGFLSGTTGILVFSMQKNQPVEIEIGSGFTPTAFRIDGDAVPGKLDSGRLSLTATGRVSFLAIDWIRAHGIDDRRGSEVISLPGITGIQSSVFTSVQNSRNSGWTLQNMIQDVVRTKRDRLRSLTSGLQLIESETLSEEIPGDADTNPKPDGVPDSPVWQRLFKESSPATLELAAFLARSEQSNRETGFVDVANPSELRLGFSPLPSMMTTLTVLLATFMFLAPVIGRRDHKRLVNSEASTVVSKRVESAALPEADDSTVRSPRVPN